MGCDARGKVILEDVTVEVHTDVDDVSDLRKQCLADDNPGKVSIRQYGYPEHSEADIVIWVIQGPPYAYGFLARLVKALVDSGLGAYTDTAGNSVCWREGQW